MSAHPPDCGAVVVELPRLSDVESEEEWQGVQGVRCGWEEEQEKDETWKEQRGEQEDPRNRGIQGAVGCNELDYPMSRRMYRRAGVCEEQEDPRSRRIQGAVRSKKQ